MSQRPVDLLSEAIRARAQARVRAGRQIAAAVITVCVLALFTIFSRAQLDSARRQLASAQELAADVLELERRAEALRTAVDEGRRNIREYRAVAPPINVSTALAAAVNQLPESIALDQVTIESGPRRLQRSARSRGQESGESPPRLLTAELSGFAASDSDVAELVERLAAMPMVAGVNLDFSRSRTVREKPAREFRLSFRIDLDRPWSVTERSAVAAGAGTERSDGRPE